MTVQICKIWLPDSNPEVSVPGFASWSLGGLFPSESEMSLAYKKINWEYLFSIHELSITLNKPSAIII